MALQQASRAIDVFKHESSVVPQLREYYDEGLESLLGSPEESGIYYIAKTYVGYLRCLKAVALLNEQDVLKVIDVEEEIEHDDVARAKRFGKEVNKGSAAEFSHVEVLQLLGDEKRKELFELAVAGANYESDIFAGALEECVKRLKKGSELAAKGEKPSDKNTAFHDAYFGHTLGLTPKAMVHFVISHYLTRTFQAQYKNDPEFGQLAFDKDAIHGIISVGMRLLIAHGKCSSEIAEMWVKKRAEGGLEWHNDKYDSANQMDPKQHFYNEAFGG